MTLEIHAATGERRIPALKLLFARFPVEDQETRVVEALAAGEAGRLSLEHLFLAERDGQPVGAALIMIQQDGVALVWPPVVHCGAADPTEVEDQLMRHICSHADAAGARLSQSLLALDDEVESAILRRAGFDKAAEMFFLARTLEPQDAASAVDLTGVSVETYTTATAERFARLIEATYQESLDCPYLSGVRTGDEALASHKLSGEFCAEHWRLFVVEGIDAGVLLLSDHPEQDAVELVYLGVAPAARGQGLGRRMLQMGLADAARRGRAVMFLAVDAENHFANALYTEVQFVELARRQILLRRGPGLARQ